MLDGCVCHRRLTIDQLIAIRGGKPIGQVKEKVGIAVFDIGAMLIEDRKREKEKLRGVSMDTQKLSRANLLVAYLIVCCFSFKEKMFYI